MAKLSAIQRNLKRIKLEKKFKQKRKKFKDIVNNRKLPLEERFQAQLKLAKLPKNSSKIRIRNRCKLTGRTRGVYRKFGLSRIKIRELSMTGALPGVVKSSW